MSYIADQLLYRTQKCTSFMYSIILSHMLTIMPFCPRCLIAVPLLCVKCFWYERLIACRISYHVGNLFPIRLFLQFETLFTIYQTIWGGTFQRLHIRDLWRLEFVSIRISIVIICSSVNCFLKSCKILFQSSATNVLNHNSCMLLHPRKYSFREIKLYEKTTHLLFRLNLSNEKATMNLVSS